MNSDTGAPSTPTGGLASVSGAATARVDRWNVRRTAAEKELARVTRILDVMNAARVEHIARQGM